MRHRNRLRRCTHSALRSRPRFRLRDGFCFRSHSRLRDECRRRYRFGTTLVEQIVIMTVLGLLAALAVRSISQQLDKLAVRSAAREARDVFASAREFAVARGVRTASMINASVMMFSQLIFGK